MFSSYRKEKLLLLYNSVKVLENPGSFMQNLLEKVEKSPGKSWNSVENPGTFMQNLLEKMEKSPGKSWNLNEFFWWEP